VDTVNLVDFDFELPDDLIAQYPVAHRDSSRLLEINPDGAFVDHCFSTIGDILEPGDLLVVNDTKVIKARLYGAKDSGGRIEIMLERLTDERTFVAQIKASKAPRIGQYLLIDGAPEVLKVVGRQETFFIVQIENITCVDLTGWFQKYGHLPLPPYVQRDALSDDESRYQTVYAKHTGAVAAPTAGLHYTPELLAHITGKGIEIAQLTLHVGAGTYQPVRVDNIKLHKMHSEYAIVNQQVCDAVNHTRSAGGRVVAVGTTSVRSLETAALHSSGDVLEPFAGETDIFIYPGFNFKVVDCLQTNFHLPQSTLMMLVSAFVDRDTIMSAYAHAVKQRYRFFSYGDAMFLHRRKN
jgi:S-adenosylmethionine:tRNA ribosyltransferase-isomerase